MAEGSLNSEELVTVVPRVFDRAAALADLRDRCLWRGHLPWEAVADPFLLSREAAHFWLEGMLAVLTLELGESRRADLAQIIGEKTFDGQVVAADIAAQLAAHTRQFYGAPEIGLALVWLLEEKALVQLFRVTEEEEYMDAEDQKTQLNNVMRVGIPHPLDLTQEARAGWGILDEYEIIPPFEQLARSIYRPEVEELKANQIKRCCGVKIPGASLVTGLERRGWENSRKTNAHDRYFAGGEVTAVAEYEPGLYIGKLSEAPEQEITVCYFLKGKPADIQDGPRDDWKKLARPLAEIPPIVFSEVMRDLMSVTTRSKG